MTEDVGNSGDVTSIMDVTDIATVDISPLRDVGPTWIFSDDWSIMLDSIPEMEDIICLDEDDGSSECTGTVADLVIPDMDRDTEEFSGNEGTVILVCTGKLGVPVVVGEKISKVDIDGSLKCVEDSIRIEEVAISCP